MNALWARLAARLDAKLPRERILLFAAVLCVVVLLPFQFIIDPGLREIRDLRARSETSRATLQAVEPQLSELQTRLAVHPDDEVRSQLVALEAQLAGVTASLERMQSGLVTPARMPDVVRDLVARHPRLRVVAFRSIPASLLLERPDADDKPRPGEAALYKHGLEFTLEGGYGDLLDYAGQIEKMSARMFWNRTAVDASAYPRVRMTLTVFTLGLERTWLTL